MTKLVDTVKMRWRIERDYQELKQEFGLSHYEGRGWRGFHHHATLTIAAYAFLVAERLIDPSSKKHRISQSACLTQRFPPARRRCGRLATCPTRSRRYAWPSRVPSPGACLIARAAGEPMYDHLFIDAVRLNDHNYIFAPARGQSDNYLMKTSLLHQSSPNLALADSNEVWTPGEHRTVFDSGSNLRSRRHSVGCAPIVLSQGAPDTDCERSISGRVAKIRSWSVAHFRVPLSIPLRHVRVGVPLYPLATCPRTAPWRP